MTSIDSGPAIPRPSAISPRSVDRFLWGFPVFALGCEVFLAALKYVERFNGSFIVTFLFFALIALIILAIALVGIVFLLRGRFKNAAALLLAPFIIAAPFLYPILRYEDFVFDFIRFQLTKGTYVEAVDRLSPAERASRILFFGWGNEGLAGISGSSEYWLVYDESGEIALPAGARSQSWKDRANKEKGYFSDEKCLAEAHHLGGHYYSAAMRCPY
jgi:hypothetical protein